MRLYEQLLQAKTKIDEGWFPETESEYDNQTVLHNKLAAIGFKDIFMSILNEQEKESFTKHEISELLYLAHKEFLKVLKDEYKL